MPPMDGPYGGDPPCWSHLFDGEAGDGDAGDAAEVRPADLEAIARSDAGRGPVWSLRGEDLDVNLLVFGAGDGG